MNNQLQAVTEWVMGSRELFLAQKPPTGIEFDREAGYAVQLLQASDYLTKAAYSDGQSLVDAVTNIAAIGISLNPAKKQAYLVPRKIGSKLKVVLDISYRGMADLAVQGGAIQWVQAKLVHAADRYVPGEFGHPPLHEYQAFAKRETRGDLVGVYCVAKTSQGDYLVHEMPIDDVWSIRNRSESWKAHVADKSKSTPWLTDEGEMVKKTAIKQASKLWPKCDALNRAINYLDTAGGEGIELASNELQDPQGLPEYSDEQLEKNLPSWRKLIEAGRKSPEDIVATVASKARLSADQIRRINNLKPIEMEA